MRTTSVCALFVVALGFGACNAVDDPPPPVGDEPQAGSGSSKPQPNAEPNDDPSVRPSPSPSPSSRPPPGGPIDPPGPDDVQDRCLAGTCQPTKLPEQPELEFLEDMGDGWQRLMEVDWQLSGTSEGYRCKTFTIPEDIYIVAFAPQSPPGTHHSTYGVSSNTSRPDEVVSCGVGSGGERRLQGSGAGSEPSELPKGVAMPLRKGDQVLMNLHLFNFDAKPLSGRSGMWVKTVPASEVEHEAEAVLAGPLQLSIPVGRSTQRGACTLHSDATVFGIGPHMHQKGVHLSATASTATGSIPLYDGDYDFSHQLNHPIEPVQLKAGDRVMVECTYLNDTDAPLHWGDSTLDEMCFISMSLYPAGGYSGLPCSN